MKSFFLSLLVATTALATVEDCRRLHIPVWRSTGVSEPIVAGLLSAQGKFIPLFRTQNIPGIPEGHWIEDYKWKFICELVLRPEDTFRVGPREHDYRGSTLLEVAPPTAKYAETELPTGASTSSVKECPPRPLSPTN
jgi:hypothetical protein